MITLKTNLNKHEYTRTKIIGKIMLKSINITIKMLRINLNDTQNKKKKTNH